MCGLSRENIIYSLKVYTKNKLRIYIFSTVNTYKISKCVFVPVYQEHDKQITTNGNYLNLECWMDVSYSGILEKQIICAYS